MCFIRTIHSDAEEALQALKRYVCASAEPEVNKQLRKGNVTRDVALLENLLTEYSGPSILYRHFNIFHEIKIGTLCEPTFLSTTKSFYQYYGRLWGNDLGCLKIHIGGADIKAIDVDSFRITGASEEEVILPRNLKFEVMDIQRYTEETFDEFIRNVKCDDVMNSKTLIADHINSYTIYDVKIIES